MALEGIRERIKSLDRSPPMRDFVDYDAYWQERVTVGATMPRWKLAAELIPDNSSVLDVGCGSGEFMEYLRGCRPSVRVVGCDFSTESVAITREKGFPDSYQLDLAEEDIPGEFDYVTCFEVLEHIPNAEDALVRLRQACRRQIIISVPNVGYLDNRIRLALFGRFPITNCIYHIKEHVRHWTERDFREWVGHFGLRVVRVAPQYDGGRLLPVNRFPGLLSPGLVYVLEPTA